MRYLAWFALPFCSALLLGCLLPVGWLVWPLGGLFALLAVLPALLSRPVRRGRVLLALAAAGAGLGFCWFGLHQAAVVVPLRALDGQTSGFTAQVAAYPSQTDYGVSVLLRVESGAAQGRRVQVYLEDWYRGLKPGDQLTGTAEFAAVLEEPEGTGRRLAAGDVFLQADVELASVYSVPSVPARYLPARLGQQLKGLISSLYDGQQAALLQGLIVGDESGLSDGLYTSFRRSGLVHLLSVSGLHVAFLSGMIYLLPGQRRRRIFLAIPLMACFALMTGGESPVWRSVVMGSLLLMAPLFGRETDPVTSLSFALLVLLLPNPYAVLGVGLQLSFASVAGLACFGGKMYDWMTKPLKRASRGKGCLGARLLQRLWRWVAAGLSASCCASVFTLPLTAWYFGSVSLVGPLANLCGVWAGELAFGLGLVSCVLTPLCPPLGELLCRVVGWLLEWLTAVAEALGGLNFAAVSLDNLYLRVWLAFLMAMVALVIALPGLRRRPILPVCSTVGLLALALTLRMATLSGPGLCVSVLDVGQGACTVFSSDGAYVAVDCGGYQAGDVLADYLQSGGAGSLSVLVLTHYDSDHVDGVEELLARVEVDTLVLPDVADGTGTRDDLAALARSRGCGLRWISDRTLTVGFGEAVLTVCPPVSQGEDNASGLAALCTWEERAVLVTGDLEQEQEELLLQREKLPDLDLLVAGHHGSATSTGARLLAALSPETAVISVGDNAYAMPSEEVLGRLADYRCDIYRTDRNGTVTVRYQ